MNEFTAVVERDQSWFVAYCLEIPGANGQGRTKSEALQGLKEAIALILHDRREDARRGIPTDDEPEVRLPTSVRQESDSSRCLRAASWPPSALRIAIRISGARNRHGPCMRQSAVRVTRVVSAPDASTAYS